MKKRTFKNKRKELRNKMKNTLDKRLRIKNNNRERKREKERNKILILIVSLAVALNIQYITMITYIP
jgi:hypothetical protein